jgi:hypothetical protein
LNTRIDQAIANASAEAQHQHAITQLAVTPAARVAAATCYAAGIGAMGPDGHAAAQRALDDLSLALAE